VLCDACHSGEHFAILETVVDELRFPEFERTYS
jgi:hypothetical protein